MATTRTPGITVLAEGRRFIDKRRLGVGIDLRVGVVTQDKAEKRLRTEMARVECDVARKAHARPTFTDCAARYIEQSHGKRSVDIVKWHVSLLQSYIGDLEPQQVHDQTLEPFIKGAACCRRKCDHDQTAALKSRARSSIAPRARIAIPTGVRGLKEFHRRS